MINILEELVARYNVPSFIERDPISIPYMFAEQRDREVAGFLVSLIAWGNRKAILKSGAKMIERMESAPYDFIVGGSERDFKEAARGFVHRTFSGENFEEMLTLLHNFYTKNGTLGDYFQSSFLRTEDLRITLREFREELLRDSIGKVAISRHVSSIEKGSACKRLCMFLRWMVRCDGAGVDMGLWRDIPPSALYIPLDVHSARQGRAFGLLHRKCDDWKAVEELTASLRKFDREDPTKYDFALFGLGVDNL